MVLATFKRLFKGDYNAQYQDLVEQLSLTINNGFDNLYNLTVNRISLKDNISCTLKTVQISVDSSGNPVNPVVISLSQTTKVQGLTLLNLTNLVSSTTYPTSGVHVSFSVINSGVSISNVTGLLANNKYQMNIVIFQD